MTLKCLFNAGKEIAFEIGKKLFKSVINLEKSLRMLLIAVLPLMDEKLTIMLKLAISSNFTGRALFKLWGYITYQDFKS